MLKIASWVARSAMILAALVGLAATGIVASMLIPDIGRDDSCELKTPYLAGDGSIPGREIEVVVDPAGCDLNMPEGQTIYLTFAVTDIPVPHEGEFQASMAPDGSLHASLPIDPRSTAGTITVEVLGSIPGCDGEEQSCAAWIHELQTREAASR